MINQTLINIGAGVVIALGISTCLVMLSFVVIIIKENW